MKISNQLIRFTQCAAVVLLAGILSANAEPKSQRMFASPDEAVKALQTAAEAKDKAALTKIFGPEYRELSTGDEVQDANGAAKFAAAMSEGVNQVKDGDDKITLEIGTNNWPMPIPLMKAGGQWYFDTAEGKEEIITRHIGKDELHAIGVCEAYVEAQKQFADLVQSGGGPMYALKFKSSPGKKDGLYWPAAVGEASPFGPLVAEAHSEGYGSEKSTGLHAFHGYYFRILTKQGKDAPGGKMDYMKDGKLSSGFALIAYPEHWDQSGIMTFIVNQDGKIYQRNLGEKTAHLAKSIKEYNPDGEWTIVQDQGVNAVNEK
jgi:Protein of unknown function (DUF2950)